MSTTDKNVDPLQSRKPPKGLTRAERRAWRETEAVRLAEAKEQARTGGIRSVLATTPPKGLGRAGRRVWREADRENRSRRMQAEAAGSEADRYVGAMVLTAVIAVVIAMRVLFSAGSDDPAPAPSSRPAVTYQATPTATPTPVTVPRGE